MSFTDPNLTLKGPARIWNRSIRLDYPKLFSALAESKSALSGNPLDVAGAVAKLLPAVGLEQKPGELAWLLVSRAVLQTCTRLAVDAGVETVLGQPPQAERLGEMVEGAIGEVTVTVDEAFFTRPGNLPVLGPLQGAYRTWLRECCELGEETVAGISSQFGPAFVAALDQEWRRLAGLYQAIHDALSGPFRGACVQEIAWLAYQEHLHGLLDQKVFGDEFTLGEIYIEPRAWYVHERRDVAGVDRRNKERPKRIVVDLFSAIVEWVRAADARDALRVVSGGPGSGKSSFSRYVAAKLPAVLQADDNCCSLRIVWVEMRQIHNLTDLEGEVARILREQRFQLGNPLCPTGGPERLLLILDGLDELTEQGQSGREIADTFLRHLMDVVENQNKRDIRLQVLLTGRELAVQEAGTRLREPHQILHVVPYFVWQQERSEYEDPAKLLQLDQRDQWWQTYGQLKDEAYIGLPNELRRPMFGEITSQPLLNYLLARLGVDSWRQVAKKELPSNYLYERFLRDVHARVWGPSAHPGVADLRFEMFDRLLQEIALVVWHTGGRTASLSEIQLHCQESGLNGQLEAFADQQNLAGALVAFYFHQALDGRTYEFTHRSFGEYLAARRIVTELEIRLGGQESDLPIEQWDAGAFLKAWCQLCGPAELPREIFRLLRGELYTRELAREGTSRLWQQRLTAAFNQMLHHGMPIERVLSRETYKKMDQQARRAEWALLAALTACAGVSKERIPVTWPNEFTARSWLERLHTGPRMLDRLPGRNAHPPLTILNLSHMSFAGCQLSGIRFGLVFLAYADLSDASLAQSVLISASLRAACLRRADLQGARLQRTDLQDADLGNASLYEAKLFHAKLIQANLRETSLQRADLRGADFTGADLRDADLWGAIYDDNTRWPEGFDPNARGLVFQQLEPDEE